MGRNGDLGLALSSIGAKAAPETSSSPVWNGLPGPTERDERRRIPRCHTAANCLHGVAREQRSHRFPTGFRFGVEHFFELGRALLVSEAVAGVVGQCDDLVFDREPIRIISWARWA